MGALLDDILMYFVSWLYILVLRLASRKRRDNLIVPRAELRDFEHKFGCFRLVTWTEFHKDQSVFSCRVQTYMGTIRIC